MRKYHIIISIALLFVIVVVGAVIVILNKKSNFLVRPEDEILKMYNQNSIAFQNVVDTLNKYDNIFTVTMRDKKVRFNPNILEYKINKEFENNLDLILNELKFNIITKDKEKGYIMFGSNQGIIYAECSPEQYIGERTILIKDKWYYFSFCYV